MKIAIDLEGTLVPEYGEFPAERTQGLARLLFLFSLRRDARRLLQDLAQAGHTLTLYTEHPLRVPKLRLWCWILKLPFHNIVTQERALKVAQKHQIRQRKRFEKDLKALGLTHFGKEPQAVWPPCAGQELLLDDDPRHIEAAWRSGVRGILVTNRDADWTAGIRAACLAGESAESVALV